MGLFWTLSSCHEALLLVHVPLSLVAFSALKTEPRLISGALRLLHPYSSPCSASRKRARTHAHAHAEMRYLLRSRQIMVTCFALLASAASMASHANAPEPSTTTFCAAAAGQGIASMHGASCTACRFPPCRSSDYMRNGHTWVHKHQRLRLWGCAFLVTLLPGRLFAVLPELLLIGPVLPC